MDQSTGGESRRGYDRARQDQADMLQNVDFGPSRMFQTEVAAEPDKSSDPTVEYPIDTGKAPK